MKEIRKCELCNSEASIYCPSDSAFLCSNCDVTVHQANFLVARHPRYSLSSSNKPINPFHSQSFANNKTTSSKTNKSTSCSSSVTTTTTCSLFVKWSRELELGGVYGHSAAASMALCFCVGKWKRLPFRVAAATSFWFGLTFSGFHHHNHNLIIKRLEAISGVPAKLFLAAHAKLARLFTPHRLDFYYSHLPPQPPPPQEEEEEEEGWDES